MRTRIDYCTDEGKRTAIVCITYKNDELDTVERFKELLYETKFETIGWFDTGNHNQIESDFKVADKEEYDYFKELYKQAKQSL